MDRNELKLEDLLSERAVSELKNLIITTCNSCLQQYQGSLNPSAKTRTMYVLQREDGKFYWKDEWVEGFENAFLFPTKTGAKTRAFKAGKMSRKIREVKVQLI